MDWLQVGASLVAVLGLGLAGVVYMTRQLNRQFDRIDDRFDKIDARFDRLEERIASLEQWQARADERFDRMDERFDRMDERFDRMDERFVRLETRLDDGLQDVRGDLTSLGMEQARMLGFLEGRGVMGMAQPEPAPEAER